MGVEYSSGIFLSSTKFLLYADLIRLESRILKHKIHCPSALLNKKDIKAILEINDMQAYVIFKLFDFSYTNRVSALDIFGAMGLASGDSLDNRVRFIFSLMDTDRDNCISQTDADILLYCVARGFSHLKQLRAPSFTSIQSIVRSAFHRELTILTERNFIPYMYLKAFLLVYEPTRLYFANIGTKVVTRDVNKLLEERHNLKKDMAAIITEIKLLEDSIDDESYDRDVYSIERGGDYHLLQLSVDDVVEEETQSDTVLCRVNKYVHPSKPSEEQRLRRYARHKAGLKSDEGEINVRDALIFENGCLISASSSGASALESAFAKKWSDARRGVPPVDGELLLDVDLLEDLFEGVGVRLSDHDAEMCLKTTPTNQLGKHSLDDILTWFHTHTWNSIVEYPAWFREIDCIYDWVCRIPEITNRLLGIVQSQRRSIFIGSNAYMRYNKFLSVIQSKTPLHVSWIGKDKEKINLSNISFRIAVKEIFEEEKVTQNSRMSTPLSRRPASSAKSTRRNKSVHSASKLKSMDDKGNNEKKVYNMKINLKISTACEGAIPIPLYDEYRHLSKALADITANDVLNHVFASKLKESHKHEIEIEIERARSVIWFFIQLNIGTSEFEGEVLAKCAANFFNSIPYEYRDPFYTSAEAESVSLYSSDYDLTHSNRVVFVMLLHERDIWKELESAIPKDVLVTKTIRTAELNLYFRDSLDELYAKSLEYADYPTKLYGPQEEELGEEGMNPLVYAKMRRQNKKALEEKLKKCDTIDLEEVKSQLESCGYSIHGTLFEIRERYRNLLNMQIKMVGFGELSALGKKLCTEIFHRFDIDGDGSLSYNEMNKMLSSMQRRTLYDSQEYKYINSKFGFQTDSHGNLTLQGFIAYFEALGHLSTAVEALGMGSLDYFLQGAISGNIDLLEGCLASLYSICDEPTYTQIKLKQVLQFISNLNIANLNLSLESFSDLFRMIFSSDDKEPISTDGGFWNSPGWLARYIHSLQEYLADGDDGLIRLIRKETFDSFKKFDQYEDVFTHLCSSATMHKEASPEEMQVFHTNLNSILPSLPNTKGKRKRLKELEKLIRILKAHLKTSKIEHRDEIKQNIVNYDLEAEQIMQNLDCSIKLVGCHILAAYDAMRMYANSVATVGMGSAEVYIQVQTKGLEFQKYLPRAHGELCATKQVQEAKVTRANQRKQEAIAALERERLRRETSEEEKERLRKLKMEALQRERDMEEKLMQDAAYLGLSTFREDSFAATSTEYRLVIDKWKVLEVTKEGRYPYCLKSAISHVNFAIVVLELEKDDDNRAKEEALLSVEKSIKETMYELIKTYNVKRIVDETLFEEGFNNIEFPKHFAAAYIVVLQNCITILRKLKAYAILSQYNGVVVTIGFLEEVLTEKEKATIGSERIVHEMIILPCGDLRKEIDETLVEFYQIKDFEMKRRELEARMLLEAARRADDLAHEETLEEKMIRLRLEKEEEKKKRREDLKNSIKTRNKLYGMIQSNEISALFEKKAKSVAEDFGADGPTLNDPFEEKS